VTWRRWMVSRSSIGLSSCLQKRNDFEVRERAQLCLLIHDALCVLDSATQIRSQLPNPAEAGHRARDGHYIGWSKHPRNAAHLRRAIGEWQDKVLISIACSNVSTRVRFCLSHIMLLFLYSDSPGPAWSSHPNASYQVFEEVQQGFCTSFPFSLRSLACRNPKRKIPLCRLFPDRRW
jgi:hypothetical protein